MAARATGPVIGVFDSGFGGLTVLRALLPVVPGAHFIFLGDTARLPYGAKSQATVARFAVESARFLTGAGAELLVIACNTATALALPEIRAAVDVPVIGVVEPGAQSALAVAALAQKEPAEREALVLATAATVSSHAYRDTCAAMGLRAVEFACPLLVPLVEEGWTDHEVTREVLRTYLREALERSKPDAVLLGCTHYPLIAGEIERTLRELGCGAAVIDSAAATAAAVTETLGLPPTPGSLSATYTCYATDSVEKFARLGSAFLGRPIDEVTLLDLGG